MSRKKGQKNTRKLKDYLRIACNIGMYVFLFFFVALYSFYAPEGYIMMATNKYLFFRKMSLITFAIMLPLVILYAIAPAGKDDAAWHLSATDFFVLFFVFVNIVSYISTDYREEALWGTEGWYMGFAMQLIFAGIYFLTSRFYDGKADVLPFFMAVTFLLFLWGLLNRFSVYPIDMQYIHPEFISGMGNINWFCGFWSVFFSIGAVLYIITEKTWLRVFSGIHAALSLGLGAVEGSDSGFLAMGAALFLLLLIAFQKTAYMKRFLEVGIYFCCVCQGMRLITALSPESLNLHSFLGDLMLGNLTLGMLILLAILRFFVESGSGKFEGSVLDPPDGPRRRADISAKTQESGCGSAEWIQKYSHLKNGIIIVTGGVFLLYIAIVAINTKYQGKIPALSGYPMVFLFDGNWGNGRGAAWRDGILVFLYASPFQKLFGVGPDCFAAFAYNIPEMASRLGREWASQRLTNAHNECITVLVNCGVLGLAAFVGIFAGSFVRLLKKAAREPVCYVFAASLLSYFIHNQFSFSQVLNTPFIYMMLGLGENLLRRQALEKR